MNPSLLDAIINSYIDLYFSSGLGLLSRHPITHTEIYHLSHQLGPDQNRRIILRAVVQAPDLGVLNVILVHFSYDRVQQCSNAAELIRFVEGNSLHVVSNENQRLSVFNVIKDQRS